MNDRELLEAAAKAAGIAIRYRKNFLREEYTVDVTANANRDSAPAWNPLTDDGDALRLAVKLNLSVFPSDYPKAEKPYALVEASDPGQRPTHASEFHDGDIYAATRRAIVRAAAALAPPQEHAA